MQTIEFHLNGEQVQVQGVAPTTTLLDYLRQHLRLTGTKEGCAEGDCGACTAVMIERGTFRAFNTCLFLLPLCHGRHIYTVEALRQAGQYHQVQQALVDKLGSQCGYCTPGVVMSMFAACYRSDLDADWKLDDQMCGNLCRCTGYRPIRDATATIAGQRPDDAFSAALKTAQTTNTPLDYQFKGQRLIIPTTWDALFEAMEAEHRIVSGATDLGLDVTQKRARFPYLISLQGLTDLQKLDQSPDGTWSIGAGVTLSDLEAATDTALPPVARMLRFFGSRQIKNRATIGGNLCNASPIGDLAPVMLSLGAVLVARSRTGERRIPVDQFFVGYRETALSTGEILARIEIPQPPLSARMVSFKVSKRREMDISAVAAGLYIEVVGAQITAARLGFGGMAATPSRAPKTEAALVGQPFTAATFEAAADYIAKDFTPIDDHRGSAWYRATVAANYVRGLYAEVESRAAPRLPDRPSSTLGGA